LNNQKLCAQRDSAILDAIETCGVIDTDQLTRLLFNFPSGKRKCQDRMKSLHDRNLVKRTRLSLDSPTIYHQGELPGKVKHSLALTWVYLWMMKRPGEILLTWDTEELKEFGLRVDALCSTKILMTKEIRWYCIELDRYSVSRNRFNKVSIYDELYKKEGKIGSYLMKKLGNPERFPKIIFITDSLKRSQSIKELIRKSETKVKYSSFLLDPPLILE
jgi:hypothetical protein